MEVSEITLFNTLKASLGEEQAQIVVEGMKMQVKEALENSKSVLATKEDLFGLRSELKGDISSLRVELKEDMHALRDELKGDISSLRVELKQDLHVLRDELKGDISALRVELKGDIASLDVKIEKTRADMIKWMFIFWISQLAAIFAMLRFLID